MNPKALGLYDLMLEQLEKHLQEPVAIALRLEKCFQSANAYLEQLRRDLEGYAFPDMASEIEFFKVIKPRFLAERNYYSLRYHAQLFADSTEDPVALRHFWLRESARLERFVSSHSLFYTYYKDRRVSNDRNWFVRKSADSSGTSHDTLVSTLLALERYWLFGEEQLKQLKITED